MAEKRHDLRREEDKVHCSGMSVTLGTMMGIGRQFATGCIELAGSLQKADLCSPQQKKFEDFFFQEITEIVDLLENVRNVRKGGEPIHNESKKETD